VAPTKAIVGAPISRRPSREPDDRQRIETGDRYHQRIGIDVVYSELTMAGGGKNYSAYQQKVIKRYYENFDAIGLQKLSELVTELYLADAKKKTKLWTKAEDLLGKLKLPADRIAHLTGKKDVKLLADLVTELSGK
jgi:hypothetical protein